MKLSNTNFRVNGSLILIMLALALCSCKRKVAAIPPTPPAPSQPAQPPPPAPTIALRAQPASIERGQSTTLQWEARNAGTVRIEPGLGEVTATGNRQVSPASSVTYTATATGPGGTATDTARVTVNVPAPPRGQPAPPRNTPAPTADELFRQNVQEIYFDYDKADIRPDQTARLQSNAAWLKEHPNTRFTVEGHCDERGSEEYNLGLGDRRANSVKEFLVSQGVPESRFTTISYGEERSVCSEQTEECYQRNRRAAFTPNP